ncbi:hypothetical protein H4Q26_004234 [Puccinia striiformis f. sp. tritici PST-130]|nr:hypothetical protein H4Q26_004234 [Puccinia striiformis f. sp. tritici PST-130]
MAYSHSNAWAAIDACTKWREWSLTPESRREQSVMPWADWGMAGLLTPGLMTLNECRIAWPTLWADASTHYKHPKKRCDSPHFSTFALSSCSKAKPLIRHLCVLTTRNLALKWLLCEKIVNDDNYPDYGVILDGEDYIGIHVDHKGTGFSCAFAQIGAARSPVKRYCCGPNPTAGTSVYVWTHKELRDGCYSRDQDGGFH